MTTVLGDIHRAVLLFLFFFQAEDGIRDIGVTGVQTCALPICPDHAARDAGSGAACARWALPAGRSSVTSAPIHPTPQRKRRSGERRVGKESRSRWSPDHLKKKCHHFPYQSKTSIHSYSDIHVS